MFAHRPALLSLAALGLGTAGYFASTVPTDIQQPGTQPQEASTLGSNCLNCHGGYDASVEPGHNALGSPMAQAGRDPLFWATVAIAEQDLDGSGNLCLRCHAPRAWLEGRATPTDGSGLGAGDDAGVECMLCHAMVNPDGSEHPGIQNDPYVAHDGGMPAEGFYGSGMYVMAQDSGMFGPYAQTAARHSFTQSRFHRENEFCNTCHDVSNPAVGDLAPGHGAMLPLPPGSFSGVPGSPVDGKAAFNLPPYRYGMVERTSSEHASSAFATLRVRDFGTLPDELQAGSIEWAHDAAMASTANGDYVDGTPRTFSCQTCHMPPVTGKGADKHNVPTRTDLPLHDMTGGNAWLADALVWLNNQGRLPLGATLGAAEIAAIRDGAVRARRNLQLAAGLYLRGDDLRVINRTGHKLITGFPEGRRMWLRVTWRDDQDRVLREDGAYGPLQASVKGRNLTVETLLDPSTPRTPIYEAKPGISQEWAATLLQVGLPASLPLEFDRITGQPGTTLGDLANSAPGTTLPTFHFVLNDTFVKDSRIPPYGFRYDDAERRAALPVPADQYGDPGSGGVYDHWDEVALSPPAGAAWAEVELLYQTTSWEYVQFLVAANDGSVTFLAQSDEDLLDAWLATGMAAPERMATTTWCVERGTGDDLALDTEIAGDDSDPSGCRKAATIGDEVELQVSTPGGGLGGAAAALVVQLLPAGAPRPGELLPGVWFDRADIQVPLPPLSSQASELSFRAGAPLAGYTVRLQAVAVSAQAANGLYATSDARDVTVQ